MQGHRGGVYHFAGFPDTTWAAFAQHIMKAAGLPCEVQGIPAAEYPAVAVRPANSRLDCSGFERDFGVARPDWRPALHSLIREIRAEVDAVAQPHLSMRAT